MELNMGVIGSREIVEQIVEEELKQGERSFTQPQLAFTLNKTITLYRESLIEKLHNQILGMEVTAAYCKKINNQSEALELKFQIESLKGVLEILLSEKKREG
jgi:hypothetical protein